MQKVIDIIKNQKKQVDARLLKEFDEERWETMRKEKDDFLDSLKKGFEELASFYNVQRESDPFPLPGENDFQVKDKKDLKGKNERIISLELKGDQEFESYPILNVTFTTNSAGEPFIRITGHRMYMDDSLNPTAFPEEWEVSGSAENRQDIGVYVVRFKDEKELVEKREDLELKVWKAVAIFFKLYDMDVYKYKVAEWHKVYGFAMERTIEDYLELGNTALAESDFEAAKYYFTELLSQDPKNEEALIGLGTAVDSAGLPLEAIQYYDQVLEINSENEIAWCQKGILLGRTGEPEKGIKCVEKALKLNPKYKAAKSAKAELIRLGEEKGLDMSKYKKGMKSGFDELLS